MSNGTVACPQVFPQFNTQAKPLPMLYALTSEGKSRELLKLAAQFAVKRILDYTVAGLGALLLGPLMLGIALLIRLDSRGPILFRQQRLGLGGKPFRLWKFRTMVVDAEDRLGGLEHLNESRGGVLFKIRHDPRVTRIGRLLPSQPGRATPVVQRATGAHEPSRPASAAATRLRTAPGDRPAAVPRAP